jgi:hypothetical protein
MSTDNIILAIATFTGPLAAVIITLIIEARRENRHKKELKQAKDDADRILDPQYRYINEWNQAFRDRLVKITQALEEIARILERKK